MWIYGTKTWSESLEAKDKHARPTQWFWQWITGVHRWQTHQKEDEFAPFHRGRQQEFSFKSHECGGKGRQKTTKANERWLEREAEKLLRVWQLQNEHYANLVTRRRSKVWFSSYTLSTGGPLKDIFSLTQLVAPVPLSNLQFFHPWGRTLKPILHQRKRTNESRTPVSQYIPFILTFSWQEHAVAQCIIPTLDTVGHTRKRAGQSQAGVSLVGGWVQHGARLDFKHTNVKVAGNLVANTDTVTHQVKERNHLQGREREKQNKTKKNRTRSALGCVGRAVNQPSIRSHTSSRDAGIQLRNTFGDSRTSTYECSFPGYEASRWENVASRYEGQK